MEIEHIDGYSTFFNEMTADCAKAETTYIDWQCIPSKSKSCPHITAKWEELKASVASQDDKKTEVTLQYFAQVPVTKIIQEIILCEQYNYES